MLSDNIRKYRKLNNMSQDELAEKLEVTRQSISLWETGQTQPSLENVVALAKLFHISTDELLTDRGTEPVVSNTVAPQPNPSKKTTKIIFLILCLICIVALVIVILSWSGRDHGGKNPIDTDDRLDTQTAMTTDTASTAVSKDTENIDTNIQAPVTEVVSKDTEGIQTTPTTDTTQIVTPKDTESADTEGAQTTPAPDTTQIVTPKDTESADTEGTQTTPPPDTTQIVTPKDTESVDTEGAQTTPPTEVVEKDIYGYLKDFVIQNGTVNGDYCYYSRPADLYGGYASEDFSLYYWGDTQKIEFCLHSVIDDTFSINFYLYVPKKHSGSYEYISSYYYRDTGAPLYEARGTINAAEFTDRYPLNCSKYIGSTDVQTEFMEMSRQGICDLIDCLREFIEVEDIKYSFKDLGFLKF